MIQKWLGKRLTKERLVVFTSVALALMLLYYAVPNIASKTSDFVKSELTLGSSVQAAGVADATCDGVADDVQAQALVAALPNTGGRVYILTGTYVWTNATTVTRAIPDVTIEGTGAGTYFTGDGVTAPFTAGGNGWALKNFSTDVTTAVLLTAMGATTDWSWENVTTSDGYFAYRTDDATTGASWDIPTGRGATYVVAASNAPAHVKAQADYVCDGVNDNVEIQAAITALSTDTELVTIDGCVLDDGGVQTSYTWKAQEATANDVVLLPAVPAVNDAAIFGMAVRSNTLTLNIGTTSPLNNWTITWEYYDQPSTAWVALAGVTDNTNGFRVAGTNTVTWTIPAAISLYTTVLAVPTANEELYWIRGRVSAYVAITTQPLGTQAWYTKSYSQGKIQLTSGVFDIAANTISVPSGLEFCGMGDSTIIKHTSSIGIMNTNAALNGNYDIYLHDFVLNGQNNGTRTFDLGGQLTLARARYCKVERVTAHNGIGHCFDLMLSQDITYTNCTGFRAGDDGFAVGDDDTNEPYGLDGASQTRNVKYIGCASYSNKRGEETGTVGGSGIEIENGTIGVIIDSCNLYDNDTGIAILGKALPTHIASLYPRNVSILNNSIKSNLIGTYFQMDSTIVIATTAPMKIIVDNNEYINNSYVAIRTDTAQYSKGITISNNYIYGIEYTAGAVDYNKGCGIVIRGAAMDYKIVNNYIFGGWIDSIGFYDPRSYIEISGNRIDSAARAGIRLGYATAGTYEVLKIQDNVITDIGKQGVIQAIYIGTAVAAINVNNIMITSNDVVSAAEYAIGVFPLAGATCNNIIVKNNLCDSYTLGAIFLRAGRCTQINPDVTIRSVKLDLSGADTDTEVYVALTQGTIVGFMVTYSEASSADAGVHIHVGRYQNGVALDDDYFVTVTSEASKNKGYSALYLSDTPTNRIIAVGDTVTIGTDGAKIGTGEVIATLYIVECAN